MADELHQPVTDPAAAPAESIAPVAELSTGASAELLSRATEFGLDAAGFQSDKDIAAALFARMEQERPYADYGRQALATPFGPKSKPEARQAEPEAPEPTAFDLDKHFSEAWKVPELSSGAQWALSKGAFTEDENGVIIPKPGLEQAAFPYLREIQEHQQAKAALTEEFSRNPVRYVWDKFEPALENRLQSYIEKFHGERMNQGRAEAFEQKFAEEHKAWLYGADGNLSPQGMKFRQAVEQLRASGLNDPSAIAKYALLEIGGAPASEAQPVEAAVPTGNGQPKGPDGKFISKQASFLENAKKQSTASGSRSAPSVEDYKPANRGELGNIWMDAFQKHRAGAT